MSRVKVHFIFSTRRKIIYVYTPCGFARKYYSKKTHSAYIEHTHDLDVQNIYNTIIINNKYNCTKDDDRILRIKIKTVCGRKIVIVFFSHSMH